MPTVRSLPGGFTIACAPSNISPSGVNRGAVSSWSSKTAARNASFLRAQPVAGFDDGDAFAATLTLGRCPDTHEDWARLRKSFGKRLLRLGVIRWHWCVEWTRNDWPHLHCSIWLPAGFPDGAVAIERHWLEVSAGHRTLARGQHVEPIRGFGGWARYVGIHSGRGVKHYQRSVHTIPTGWTSTGRMWGHAGDWHPVNPDETDITMEEYREFQLIWRAREVEKARQRGDDRGAAAAARMFDPENPNWNPVHGMSAWTTSEGEELAVLAEVIGDVRARRLITARRAASLEALREHHLAQVAQRRTAVE